MQVVKTSVLAIFFNNYFYGICAVALSIEASLQQFYPLNSVWYYILIFSATVLYYTKAYIIEKKVTTTNKRVAWYSKYRKQIFDSQILFTIIAVTAGLLFLYKNKSQFLHLPIAEWLIILAFPAVAAFYYGLSNSILSKYNLRNTGWMKPFVIGFVWGGLVTVYPVLFYCIEKDITYQITFKGFLLLTKNFMFITVLCIMFDIKDYAADHNQQLKTFVVRVGLRKTIFYIIIPLTLIGLGTFITYAVIQNFPLLRILLNIIPFILLIIVAYSLHRRKTILYYLAIIDGLMLVKAICGSIAILLTT
jgi:hypothetical protein